MAGSGDNNRDRGYMLRKLVAAMAVAGAVGTTAVPGIAYGLGLGEIRLNSSLNQPLNARIDLVEIRELSEIEILPNLATRADFERAEVARPYFLSTLRFKTVADEKGKLYIQVSSDKPVIEPFLNFLVEVHWPNGRLLREYTLLLDPPSFSSEVFDAAKSEPKPDPIEQVTEESVTVVDELPVEAVPEQAVDLDIDAQEEPAVEAELDELVEPEELPVVEELTEKSVETVADSSVDTEGEKATGRIISLTDYMKESGMNKQPDAVAPVTVPDVPVLTNESLQKSGSDGSYVVKKGDTLYDVALRTRPGRDVSVNRMMMALQGRNPGAFINGNVNLLRAGAALQIPDRETIDTIGTSTANQFIARQNREWRDGRVNTGRKVQLDATRKTEVEPVQRGTIEDDHLNIVSLGAEEQSADGADQGAGDAEGRRTRELESQMSIKQEQLATLSRENAELNDRLRDLEEQIESLEKLVSLKSDQLAALQTMEELEQEQLTGKEPAPKPAPSDVVDETVDYNYSDGSEPSSPEVAVPQESTGKETEGAAKPESGLIDRLLGNPVNLAGIGGAILLLTGAVLIIRRRKQQQEMDDDDDIIPDILKDYDDNSEEQSEQELETEAEAEAETASEEADKSKLPEAENITDAELEQLDESLEKGPNAAAEPEPEMQVEPVPVKASATDEADVISEADIYIAYSRFLQAADLLKGAIASSPERTDFRLKYLEVLVEMQDADEFQVQEQTLQETGDEQAISRAADLRQRFPASAFKSTVDEEAPAASAEDVEAIELSPEIADLDVELSGDESVEAESGPETGSDSETADSIEGLDFDLNDLEIADETPAADETVELGSLELETDKEPEAKEETLPELEDLELDASFGIDTSELEAVDTKPEAAAEEKAQDDDGAIDLSADFGSELAELDDELANISSDMNLDVEDLESALDADDQALMAEFEEQEPEPKEKPAAEESKSVAEESKPAAINLETLTADLDTSALDLDGADDDFSFLEDNDEASTKLDLARAYMEMGDADGAKGILEEVLNEGSDAQKKEAQELIDKLGS
ncbi:hypothetical protein M3P05_01800 [Sansalvadorimonas sp. 2012CJ34-2]|uniref:LysM domain-containing protein n=1 Tax=Parendozoicomonas callyspongiae TaxID=2942213 RepID=A0ABT0PD64_9GAMM|nr:FimV/HubP family polar landmark protein [Sansalvadorimonas sp. 2012CJ34-2]MCL6268687.1 hypothetical protein [Sansalvadorimonas sp. 2012CJ34-2]